MSSTDIVKYAWYASGKKWPLGNSIVPHFLFEPRPRARSLIRFSHARYKSDFLLAIVMRFFENIASPARGEKFHVQPPSHRRRDKLVLCREKFSTLNFSRFVFL